MSADDPINHPINEEQTPLMLLVLKSPSLEMIEYVLSKGADVNRQDIKGRTALMLATSQNRCDVVKLLLTAGADKSIKDKSGRTAADYIWEHGETAQMKNIFDNLKVN